MLTVCGRNTVVTLVLFSLISFNSYSTRCNLVVTMTVLYFAYRPGYSWAANVYRLGISVALTPYLGLFSAYFIHPLSCSSMIFVSGFSVLANYAHRPGLPLTEIVKFATPVTVVDSCCYFRASERDHCPSCILAGLRYCACLIHMEIVDYPRCYRWGYEFRPFV